MGISSGSGRRLRAAAAALTLACAPLLAACAATGYAGISFAPGAADPSLQSLARRALAGDKRAQLELGIRYEEGRDVAVDLRRAEWLYRTAAAESSGRSYVYAAAVGSQRRGQVIAIPSGPRVRGLDEARARLDSLRARRRGAPT